MKPLCLFDVDGTLTKPRQVCVICILTGHFKTKQFNLSSHI